MPPKKQQIKAHPLQKSKLIKLSRTLCPVAHIPVLTKHATQTFGLKNVRSTSSLTGSYNSRTDTDFYKSNLKKKEKQIGQGQKQVAQIQAQQGGGRQSRPKRTSPRRRRKSCERRKRLRRRSAGSRRRRCSSRAGYAEGAVWCGSQDGVV